MPRTTLRSQRGGRPYVEAFPALDALRIEREVMAGRSVCQWTNEQGVIVGHIAVEKISFSRLVIASHFLRAANVGYKYSVDGFELVRKEHNVNWK